MARVENPASVGLAGSALGLAIPGTVALVNQMSQGGFLGGLFGGGNNDRILALTAENTELKANKYTDNRLLPTEIEVAKQGEQIKCIEKQMNLREQIVDGKIALAVETTNTGFAGVNCAIANLQNTVNQIAQPYVPAAKITPPVSNAAVTATTTAG